MGAVKALSVEMRAVKWLWEPYVPRGLLTLVAGVPGQGKSLFTCWLVAQTSKKHHVLMSNSEDDYSLAVVPRLTAAGAKLSNVSFLSPLPVLPGNNDEAITALVAEIDRTKASLVVLDPLQDHLEQSIFSPKATQPLRRLAVELAARDVAFVAVSHTVKSLPKGAHPLYAVGGAAGGLSRVMRIVHLFGPHPNDTSQRVLAPVKANFLAEDRKVPVAFATVQKEVRRGRLVLTPGLLALVGECPGISASEIIRPGTGEKEGGPSHGDKRLAAAQWLRARLEMAEDHRLAVKVLQTEAEEAGHSWASIRRADEDIVQAQKVNVGTPGKRGAGAWYWQLPDGEGE
jgi:putative DNA primase/helicase